MKTTRKEVIAALKRNLKWLTSIKRRSVTNNNRALNLMIGCLQVCAQCRQKTTKWLDRKPGRRSRLKRVRETYADPRGNKDLRQLVELASSAAEAAIWKDDIRVEALPDLKEKKQRTEAQVQAVAAARAKAAITRAENKQAQEEALEARIKDHG